MTKHGKRGLVRSLLDIWTFYSGYSIRTIGYEEENNNARKNNTPENNIKKYPTDRVKTAKFYIKPGNYSKIRGRQYFSDMHLQGVSPKLIFKVDMPDLELNTFLNETGHSRS